MTQRNLTVALLAGALGLTLAVPTFVVAQTSAYKAPRILGNVPDLQGNWTNSSLTPLQRAATYGNRLVMTPEEARKIEGDQAASIESRNQPTKPDTKIEDLPCSPGFTGTNCGYNVGWTDFGTVVMRVNGEPRTSLITSTPDGKMPAAKPGAAPAAGRGGGLRPGMRQDDNPETRSIGERCIMSFGSSSGPIMQPQMYNSTYRLVQSKDSVAILVEMVHDVRIVRLVANKAAAQHSTTGVRPWMGESIGWYEGDKLVVETKNYHPRQAVGASSANLKVTEKFSRVSPTRLRYEFIVEDPTVWDKPWGGEYEFMAAKGDVYEYACHEGNYALEGILAGAREEERLAAAGKTSVPRPAGYNPEFSRGAAAATPVPRGGPQ